VCVRSSSVAAPEYALGTGLVVQSLNAAITITLGSPGCRITRTPQQCTTTRVRARLSLLWWRQKYTLGTRPHGPIAGCHLHHQQDLGTHRIWDATLDNTTPRVRAQLFVCGGARSTRWGTASWYNHWSLPSPSPAGSPGCIGSPGHRSNATTRVRAQFVLRSGAKLRLRWELARLMVNHLVLPSV
jgi:hypothetical protein